MFASNECTPYGGYESLTGTLHDIGRSLADLRRQQSVLGDAIDKIQGKLDEYAKEQKPGRWPGGPSGDIDERLCRIERALASQTAEITKAVDSAIRTQSDQLRWHLGQFTTVIAKLEKLQASVEVFPRPSCLLEKIGVDELVHRVADATHDADAEYKDGTVHAIETTTCVDDDPGGVTKIEVTPDRRQTQPPHLPEPPGDPAKPRDHGPALAR